MLENNKTLPQNLIKESTLNRSVSDFQTNQQGIYDQINQNFQQQNEKQKTVQEARDILGKSAENLTDSQVLDLLNNVQYLVDTWIEEYEQKVFDGKTLKELLQLNI